MYLIRSFAPRSDITCGAHGFAIELAPEWKDLVAKSGLDQEKVDHKIKLMEGEWLAACGWKASSYSHRIRAVWGAWGLEHITVPGNACGLDIDQGAFGAFIPNAAILHPHNIDNWSQKNLLMIVFTSFAEDIVLFGIS